MSSLIPSGTQRAERVFNQIALTAVEPDHPDRLWASCHGLTARFIEVNARLLGEDSMVVLLGAQETVYHSIIMQGDQVVFDCFPNGVFDVETQTYTDPSNMSFGSDMIKVIAKRPVKEICNEMRQKLDLIKGQNPKITP